MKKILICVACVLAAASLAGCYDAEKVSTAACAGRGGVANLAGGPKVALGTGVSSRGNVVTTTTVIDTPYFLTCKDGSNAVFSDGDETPAFTKSAAAK